jgi:hypothetical protein
MKVMIDDLHPTQICVGYQQVECKAKKMSEMKDSKLMTYLKDHPVPAILGYDRKTFIVDHHHLCLAANNIGIEKVYLDIIKDWSHLSYRDFWSKMRDEKYIWLYDEEGNAIKLDDFPLMLAPSVRGLKDDPYRSLAGIVRKMGAFSKDYAPFAEFHWANFFRKRELLKDVHDIPVNVIETAMSLCKSPLASSLPGYQSNP